MVLFGNESLAPDLCSWLGYLGILSFPCSLMFTSIRGLNRFPCSLDQQDKCFLNLNH